MAKTTPPKSQKKASTVATKPEPKPSRADYHRERRAKLKEAHKGRHWSLDFLDALTPFLERALTSYQDRTAKLGMIYIGTSGHIAKNDNDQMQRIMELAKVPVPPVAGLHFHSSSGAEPEAPAPAGRPSLVVGKYQDDPTGELETPLFTLDTDLTDACQTWLRTNHPNEIVNLRLYDEIADEKLGCQLMRALFRRIAAPIPADDPATAKALYNQPF